MTFADIFSRLKVTFKLFANDVNLYSCYNTDDNDDLLEVLPD